MIEKCKKILEKQLVLLSKRSETEVDVNKLSKMTNQMIRLVKILDPDLRSQSVYEPPNFYVEHLSMSNLESWVQTRREFAHQEAEEELEWRSTHGILFDQA